MLNGAAKGKRAILVERGRSASADLGLLTTRLIGFGDGDVSPATVAFLEQMIRATPIEVVARFGQALLRCDMRGSLTTLGRIPVTVIVGEKDRLIAARLGLELAAQIPGAQLVWVPGAGHALILEQPELVNRAITGLLARVAAAGLPGRHDQPWSGRGPGGDRHGPDRGGDAGARQPAGRPAPGG